MKIDTKKLLEAMFSDASIIGTDLALILLRALGKIGIEFRDGQLIEYRLKPGNWYVCIKDGIFGGFPDGDTHFHKGEVYFCDDKGIVDHYNSNFHEDFERGDCDENVWDYFCPWSISDAKPGDVLYAESSGTIILFNKVENGVVIAYCGGKWNGKSDDYFRATKYPDFGFGGAGSYKPATKEQRELLFSKIEENGYRWDADSLTLDKALKFKVGDWVVIDCGGIQSTLLITKIDRKEKTYHFNDNSYLPFNEDQCLKLWNISDARPGDVLSSTFNDWCKIVIFLSSEENDVEGYGITLKNGELWFTDGVIPYYSKTWTKYLEPATEEQRELLFSKIEENGYRWNAEELKLEAVELLNNTDDIWIPQTGDRIRKKGTTAPIYILCSKTEFGFRFVQDMEIGAAGGELSVFALDDYELVERPKTMEEALRELFEPLTDYIKNNNTVWKSEKEPDIDAMVEKYRALQPEVKDLLEGLYQEDMCKAYRQGCEDMLDKIKK